VLKEIVAPVVRWVEDGGRALTDSKTALAVAMLVVALALLLFALSRMVKIMRGALAQKMEILVDRYIFTGWFRALIVGMLITALVQSSSVTTSLVVPLLGVGIVRLEAVYPYMVGANIGTTITAILASLVTGKPAAVTIAICHLLFNIFGAAVFLPLRAVPLSLARWLGRVAFHYRWAAVAFVVFTFFALPAILVVLV